MSDDEVTLEFPDEVVTATHVRYVTLPGVAGPIALVTLDNGLDHTRPSTFGPAGLRGILTAVDEIEAHQPPVAAIAVTGKPFIFAVGADLAFRSSITDPAAVRPALEALGRLGHEAFVRLGSGRLGERRVPTFALVNGAVLGGGLELALHCDYRALSSGIPMLALPEVFLGLVPAWGGSQLLPNLVGPQRAIKIILDNPLSQNRMLKGPQAFELGLGDVLLEPADFLEEALTWVGQVLRGEIDPVAARTPVERGAAWAAAISAGHELADGRLHGAAPAPYRALDLIALAETATRADGFEAETQALADLSVSGELVAGLYAFDLVQKRARRPVGGPDPALARPVTKVGVVGAGLMASQLALVFAHRLEVPVVLTDLDATRLDAGVAAVHREIDNLLLRRRITADQAGRYKANVTGSLTKDAFADADLVIEAVFEDLSIKQKVFAELEAVVSPQTVLLTNTSALSVSEMATHLAHPERVAGLHFFNPVAVLPLVEVVRAERTDDATVATTLAVAKALKKNAVLVADRPAFVVNRLLTRFLGEVLAAAEQGTPLDEVDHALDPLGLPMSPLTLLALVGPPVALHVAETLHTAFPDRFREPSSLARLVEAGKGGIYTAGPDGTQTIDPEAAAALRAAVAAGGTSTSAANGSGSNGGGGGGSGGSTVAPSAAEVREAALRALAEEIHLMLAEKVVAEAPDIDLCMILGAGWPFHLGGITPYLDRTGVSEAVTGERFTPPGVATLPV
ncbi:3-hydroxyacyl-CoA dehydrogenase NAD-binding domain-containing protein [Frankia sp. AgPm24]|uniref:3-hydroxyacyl-CoA dehydrogenase NAD-binding domain-containing protein n=1 Tax=Frankia sp. AgPm24 TaxID=631128 RepID=UPI00200E21DB|nr:3-hydroxyacyl-CoA dehydrogenase NAD-binding domain-containing protein [Frankia sp. AgPm24]MCK9924319.1 3-hydroxyacyl-CoA dehydrogenase NAD-binding domain-containing protein [Frankia sp. AgPm24]